MAQLYIYYLDGVALTNVISDTYNRNFDQVDTCTVKLLIGDRENFNRALYLEQLFTKVRVSDTHTVFRGYVSEVRFDPSDRYNVVFKIRAASDCVAELSFSKALGITGCSTKVLGSLPYVTTGVQTGPDRILDTSTNFDDNDYTGDYTSGDHAVMIVPGTSASHAINAAEDTIAYSNAPDSTGGVFGNVNDNSDKTSLNAGWDGNTDEWMSIAGSSATAKASVTGFNVKARVKANLRATTTTVYLEYEDENAAWQELDSYVIPADLLGDLINGFTPVFELEGSLTANTFLDGADDWNIRIRIANASSGQLYIYWKNLIVDIYSDGIYSGEPLPISGWLANVGVSLTVDPVAANVDVGDTYVIGIDDADTLTALLAKFSNNQARGVIWNIDANISGYNAIDWTDRTVLELIEFMCEKHQAHWYFDHHAWTVYIIKESTIEAGGGTLRQPAESDVDTIAVDDKITSYVKAVTVNGATFKTHGDTEITCEYTYPSYGDTHITNTSNKILTIDDETLTSETECRKHAEGIYNTLNTPKESIDLTFTAVNTYTLRDRFTATIHGNVITNEPITGMTEGYNVEDNIITQSFHIGWQSTTLQKRLVEKIENNDRRIRKIRSSLRAHRPYEGNVLVTGSSEILNANLPSHVIVDEISNTSGDWAVDTGGNIDLSPTASLTTPTIIIDDDTDNPATITKTADINEVEFDGDHKVVDGHYRAQSVTIGDQVISESNQLLIADAVTPGIIIKDTGDSGVDAECIIYMKDSIDALLMSLGHNNNDLLFTAHTGDMEFVADNDIIIGPGAAGAVKFTAKDVNFANGTTYKVEADGDAVFKDVTAAKLIYNSTGTPYIQMYDTNVASAGSGFVQMGKDSNDQWWIQGQHDAAGDVTTLQFYTKSSGGAAAAGFGDFVFYPDQVEKFRIAADGTITITDGEFLLAGTARVVRDVWVPFNAIRVPAAGSPATFVDHGISGAWEFSDNASDTIVGNMKFPNDMDMSVAPSFCLGWSSNTAGVAECAVWQLEYLYTQVGEDTTAAAQATITVTDCVGAAANGLQLATFPAMAVPNAADVCLHIRVKRLGADGNDDLTDTAELHGLVMLYTSNKLGTAT